MVKVSAWNVLVTYYCRQSEKNHINSPLQLPYGTIRLFFHESSHFPRPSPFIIYISSPLFTIFHFIHFVCLFRNSLYTRTDIVILIYTFMRVPLNTSNKLLNATNKSTTRAVDSLGWLLLMSYYYYSFLTSPFRPNFVIITPGITY